MNIGRATAGTEIGAAIVVLLVLWMSGRRYSVKRKP